MHSVDTNLRVGLFDVFFLFSTDVPWNNHFSPYFLVMKTLGLLNSHLGLILAYCVTALPLCLDVERFL